LLPQKLIKFVFIKSSNGNTPKVIMQQQTTNQIIALVKKEILLEIRQQYTFYGIILYVASTLFVIFLSMGQPEDKIWNALFWIVQLFVCVNAVAKSFLAESKGRMLYFFTICGARGFILSKIIFNLLLMLTMSIVSLLLFILLLDNPLNNVPMFIGITCLGGCSISLVFTFLAAIAAKAQQQAALMAIMGFPIIIPQLLLLMKIATPAFSSVVQEGWWQMIGLLIILDAMVVLLSFILFPFLWKD
jgi:heme exporter protein B